MERLDLYYKRTLSLKHQFCPILHQATVCCQINLLFDSQPLLPAFQLQRHQYFHSVAINHCNSLSEHFYLRVWLKSKTGQAQQFLAGNFSKRALQSTIWQVLICFWIIMKKEHLTHPLLDKEQQFRLFAKFSSSFTCICSLTFADSF